MPTTQDDWDLWEQELPPLREPRPLSMKVAIGLAAVALVAAIVAPVALVIRAGDIPSPATTVLPLGPGPSAGARAVAPLPTRYVATTTDGRLVVLTGAGRLAARIGAPAPRVALMPGGQAAVVELADPEGRSELQWWDLSGQPAASGPPFASDARYPAFGPDGRLLAYTQGHPAASTLVVLDLATGTPRRWEFPEGHDLQLPSWAPDGRSLVITEVTATDRRTVVFDTDRPEGPVTDLASIGGSYRLTVFRGARPTLVAVGGTEPGGPDIVEVDPATGATRAAFTTPFAVVAIHPDPSGEYALLVAEKAALYVWANGSISQVLDGVLGADW